MEKKKFTKPELKIVNMEVESVIAASGVSQAKGITFEDMTVANGNNSYGAWN